MAHKLKQIQGCMKDLSYQAIGLILDKQQCFRPLIFKYVQLGLYNIPVHWGTYLTTSVTTSVQEYMDSGLSSSWGPVTVLKISFELCGDSIHNYERDNILAINCTKQQFHQTLV